MANVYCVFVKLCVLFIIILNVSNSKEIQNIETDNNFQYDVIRNPPNTNELNFNLRFKREVSADNKPVIPDPVVPVVTSPIGTAATIKSNDGNQTQSSMLESNKHLLGVNGTGQRLNISATAKPAIVSEPLNSDGTKPTTGLTAIESIVAPNATISSTPSASDIVDKIIGEVDEPEETINETLRNNLNVTYKDDYYQYYNSTTLVDKVASDKYWSDLSNFTTSGLLSKSHRRAITLHLSFDFPFYGHPVRNVTIATGGFLYTGEYVHSWLAATQYIAPLMANFDTSISNASVVKFSDNGTAFTVVWENVSLQERHDDGSFTFSVSLYNNGDITFAYKSVPILIEKIVDDKHPVKIGLSDAYIIDNTIFFARRKTIYEYHRINFNSQDIKNHTLIHLTALPTCLEFTECGKCVTNSLDAFKCSWCPALLRCSTGTDRKKQEWIQNGCERSQVSVASACTALGTKGNNYASQQPVIVPNSDKDKWRHGDTEIPSVENKMQDVTKAAFPHISESRETKSGGAGFVVGLFLPLVVVMSLVAWVFYAYRNPHTKSGQLLIQYRPSQWSWRRGEARYTAATIHM